MGWGPDRWGTLDDGDYCWRIAIWLIDSLKAVMDTAYPGKRVSLGGDMPKRDILLFLTNWKMPFQDVPYSNNSEISSFINYFCYFAALTIYFYKKSKKTFTVLSYSCIVYLT